MSQYLAVFHEAPDAVAHLSPAEMQALIGRYKEWFGGLRASGKYVASNKLEDGTGRVMRGGGSNGPRVTDGPFTETKDVMGGYFLVESGSFEEVVDLCRDCPHLEWGAIEIRKIEVV